MGLTDRGPPFLPVLAPFLLLASLDGLSAHPLRRPWPAPPLGPFGHFTSATILAILQILSLSLYGWLANSPIAPVCVIAIVAIVVIPVLLAPLAARISYEPNRKEILRFFFFSLYTLQYYTDAQLQQLIRLLLQLLVRGRGGKVR